VLLEAWIAELEALNTAQAATIEALLVRIAELETRLETKDSGNSSMPPSRDGPDRRQRRAAERDARKQARADAGGTPRPPGKQPGAPGSTLRRRAPDTTVTHSPACCRQCAADLADAVVVGTLCRQVLDIPEPSLVVTDHVIEKRRCRCGHVTAGVFPAEATAAVCWGPRVKAVAVYLMIRQHIPLERAHEALEVLFAAPVSQGSLAAWPIDAAQRLQPFTTELFVLLKQCAVVCADETPIRVGTATGYVHTISTDTLTMLAHHTQRGLEAIVAIGALPGYTGVIMHDGYGVYNCDEFTTASHAQCHAHLDRHLVDVGAWVKHKPWCDQMRRVLWDIQAATRAAVAAGHATVESDVADPLKARYQQTLGLAFEILPPGPPARLRRRDGWHPKDRAAWNLACRFRDQHEQILRLLDDTRIPATNNDAERSLRMCKIHDKIAGRFANPVNAEAFCTIRSYIQTGRKQAQNTLTNLTRIYTETPWLPTT
jgi:transposase